MNPESMMRPPYMKAMAQTIGAMALVDKDQDQWSIKEITDTVQDKLQAIKGDGKLLTRRVPEIFNIKNIAPFHINKNVPFYDNLDDGNFEKSKIELNEFINDQMDSFLPGQL